MTKFIDNGKVFYNYAVLAWSNLNPIKDGLFGGSPRIGGHYGGGKIEIERSR